jgi:hypothetical protein
MPRAGGIPQRIGFGLEGEISVFFILYTHSPSSSTFSITHILLYFIIFHPDCIW